MTTTPDDLVKEDDGPLVPFERWMGRTALPFVPRGVTANHVTMMSGAAGLLAGLAFYLASFHNAWFGVAALLVLVQWWADNTDGHVARSRGQSSPAGRFLDLFLDCCTFTALGLGLSFATYAQFPIVAIATMLCLLQYVLTALWIALARIWPFPVFGPGEASLSLIVVAALMPFVPRVLVTVAGVPLSLVDLAFAATIPSSLITLWISARRLFRHLQQAGVGQSAAL